MKVLTNQEIKEIQLDILSAVDLYCSENNLSYYLFYGTLIGAIRHHGYIPWDDDIDIAMKRDDYERFISNFNIGREDRYKVYSSISTPEYFNAFAKVSDESTLLIEDVNSTMEIGVNIDVFPLDKLPDDDAKRRRLMRKIKKQIALLNLKKIPVSKNRAIYKNLILSLGGFALRPIPYSRIVNNISNLSKSCIDEENSTKVGSLSLLVYKDREILNASDFDESIRCSFENHSFMIPKGYDNILTHLYGNYMKLPSIDKQVTHHSYQAYRKKI